MRVFVFSGPGGHVASICEEGDRLQIASPLRMTHRAIAPSSYSQSLCVCGMMGRGCVQSHKVECCSWLVVAPDSEGGRMGPLQRLA